MTKQQLIEKLRNIDEVFLLELLDIKSDDLVDAFIDKLDDRYGYIEKQFEDTEN